MTSTTPRRDWARAWTLSLVAAGISACGDGPTDPDPDVDPAVTFVQVAAGGSHSCALDSDGGVHCWGRNAEGQLGLGAGSADVVLTPSAVESDRVFTTVAVGDAHSCALDTTGAAHCWGDNDLGQVGDGSTTERRTPVPVVDGHLFVELTVGARHACGRVSRDEVYCWGDDSAGQLGNLASASSATPVPVELEIKGGRTLIVETIDAGGSHTCALDNQGAPYCWGNNGSGQHGNGGTTSSERPGPASGAGIFNFTSIRAGGSHTCASASGRVDCWGFNLFGQLGDGGNNDDDTPDSPTLGGTGGFTDLSPGADHSCAVDAAGTGYCWGFNGGGRLGDGTETDRNVPTELAGDVAFGQISAGVVHSCGVDVDGSVYCWGFNTDGQLGDGTVEARSSPTPVELGG